MEKYLDINDILLDYASTFEDEIGEQLDRFCDYLVVYHGLKFNTVHGYYKIARKFLENVLCLEPNHEQVSEYMVGVHNKKYSYSHINNTSVGVEKYMEFIGNGIKLGRPAKPKRILREPLTEAEMVIILESTINIRERAILTVLAYSGIRANELCQIKVKDIDLGNNEILIHGKGNKDRIVNISSKCTNILLTYLALHPRDEDCYFFTSERHGNQYTTWALRRLVKIVTRRTKIKRRVYPHLFRHSLATNLINRGANPRTVQKQLGHSYLETTMIYVESRPQTVKMEYHAFSPSYI